MKQIKNFFIVFFMVALTSGSAFAANGCENQDKNDRINPALALCSVHAYNIGHITNPQNSADKQLMNEVVALKTTVMTQQMKKQFDYLEVTIRRFKTQLEKAILMAKLEAAGATSSGGSQRPLNSAGTSNYMVCGMKSRADTIQCVRQNISTIYAGIAGKTGMVETGIRNQLTTDANNVAAFLTTGREALDTNCIKTSPRTIANATACMQAINGTLDTLERGTQSQNRNNQSGGNFQN